jgi:hypothetical protein
MIEQSIGAQYFFELKEIPMKTTKNNYRFTAAVLGVTAILWIASAITHATVLYSNGFEPGDPGTADFFDSSTGLQPAPEITIVPSGTSGIPAASNSNFYAQITNVPDAYSAGYGQSVATDYGYVRNGGTFDPITGAPTGPGVANNGNAFYESTDYYIDPSWSASGSAANDNVGFWIDTTPYSDPGYEDETNFRVSNGGNGTINVQMVGYGVGGTYPSLSITTPGWYTFKTTFEDDGGNVSNTLSVSDATGNVLGSAFNDPTDYNPPVGIPGPLAWNDLQGTNYGDWTTVWSDGFAGDTLAIDNVEVGTVPEPASLSLLAFGVPMLLRRRKRLA